MADKKNTSKLTFEDTIKELTDIVRKIEQGEIPLADSLKQYEKGMTLINHCRGILEKAEERIEKIAAQKQSKDDGDSEKTDDALF